jgi:hypothetical protein
MILPFRLVLRRGYPGRFVSGRESFIRNIRAAMKQLSLVRQTWMRTSSDWPIDLETTDKHELRARQSRILIAIPFITLIVEYFFDSSGPYIEKIAATTAQYSRRMTATQPGTQPHPISDGAPGSLDVSTILLVVLKRTEIDILAKLV